MPRRKQTNEQPEALRDGSKPFEQDMNPPQPQEDIVRGTRQSQPKTSTLDYATGLDANMVTSDGAIDGYAALSAPIGREAILAATQTLQEYKNGKANLERRIIENEQWYKLRHWECMRKRESSEVEPTSAWLFNSLANKHADAMDNFPEPNILPREESDKGEAQMLSDIVPVVLEQNGFEKTYDDVTGYKLRSGTGVYKVYWDKNKLNGLGDISIEMADILCLFWESGIRDIQKSRNFFHIELVDNDLLEENYPQLKGKLSTPTITKAEFIYDDTVDTSKKSCVVDWFYKKRNSQGKQVVHYVKYVNDVVLYATENDAELREVGLYQHGLYPYVFDALFTVSGTPAGFGYVDVAKSAQEYIDRGNQAIMKNMLSNTKPRHFIRNDGTVNEAEYADINNDFVHVDGNLGQDSIMAIEGKQLNAIYVDVINNKINELKEVTGNRDVSTGGTTASVTAAAAIAAMQEAGSKLSRHDNKAAYRAYKEIVNLVIELIRQFYTLPRCFRIVGENGTEQFVRYSNENIQMQYQGVDFGIDMGMRLPLFDIEVSAQKQSPYNKLSQNELALQFYSAGFFNPQMADQALACLDMMDFDQKNAVINKITQNGTMYQMIQQMQQQMLALGAMVDASHGTNEVTASLINQFGMQQQQLTEMGVAEQPQGNSGEESAVTRNARERTTSATAPR